MEEAITLEHFCNEFVTKVKWRIDNFSTQASRDNRKCFLKCQPFVLHESRLTFYLGFQSIDKNEKNSSFIGLFPFDLDNEKSVELNLKFYIENSMSNRIKDIPERMFNFTSDKDGFGVNVNHTELYPPKDDDDDTIYICCEIKRKVNQADFKPISLSNKFLDLFEAHQSDDSGMCEIEADDQQRIKVDKSILAMHSDVFAKDLKTAYQENKNGVVIFKIEGFESDILEYFFMSLYGGYVLFNQIADDLFVLANKFRVDWMIKECEQILGKTLAMDNVFERLQLAATYPHSSLKDKLVDFIAKKENFEQVVKSNEWSKFAIREQDFANKILNPSFEKMSNLPNFKMMKL